MIRAEYTVTITDYRTAIYYSYVWRYRKAIRIAVFVLGCILFYLIGALLGAWALYYLIPLIGIAYLLWSAVFLCSAEKVVQRYKKQKNNRLNTPYVIVIDPRDVAFHVERENIHNRYPLDGLACVFDLSTLFLFYVTMQEVFIIPKRKLTPETVSRIQGLLQECIPDKYESRSNRQSHARFFRR